MTTNTPTLEGLDPAWVGLDLTADGAWVNVFADGTRLPLCVGAAPDDEGGDDAGEGGEGSEGDDDDAGEGGEGSDDDKEDDDEEDDEDVIKLSRADYEKLKAQKSKANKEAARRRRWLENAGIDPHTGKPKKSVLEDEDDEDDEDEEEEVRPAARRRKAKTTAKKGRRRTEPEDDGDEDEDEGPDLDELEERWARKARRAAEKAEARTELKYKAPLARTSAKAALADAGWTGKNFERVMKLIDLDDVELDDDGEIIGIEDQVDQIKEEFPDWFRRRSSSSSSRSSSAKAKSKEGKGSTKDVGGGGQAGKQEGGDWKAKLAKQAFKG